MQVNPGDPITSELMANIVSNINLINAMASSKKDASGSEDGPAPVSQVIESGMVSIKCSTASTGKQTVVFKKTFPSKPAVVCTIWQPSGQEFLREKYMPIVTAASKTEFTVQMLSLGATANGDVWVQWIAAT